MKKQKPMHQGNFPKKDEHDVYVKRPKLHVHGLGPDTDMEIESATTIVSKSSEREGQRQTVDSDAILREMVATGSYNQDEIIQFCIDAGIPLSRMLELDLMRTNHSTQQHAR